MEIYKILSTKERESILKSIIFKEKEFGVNEISKRLNLSKGLVSKYFNLLVREDVLGKEGRKFYVKDNTLVRNLRILFKKHKTIAAPMGIDFYQKIRDVIAEHKEILFAYLFGSVAKGLNTTKSDIDIGIFLKENFKKDVFYEVGLALEIEMKTNLKNIEIVVLNNKSLRFLNQVLRYGKPIFSRDEKRRINFETSIIRKYIDFKPYFEEYDRFREKRLRI
jgi:hypothetical protein